MIDTNLLIYILIAILVVAFLAAAIRILREYERGVVFTLGRFTKVTGPGLVIIIPFIQQMERVDLRVFVEDVPSQDIISKDNVSAKVNAVLYFRVVDPERSVISVANFRAATSQLAQTTLRSTLGKHELDTMLSERERLNADIQEILDTQTDPWGIKVTNVEIKHVDIDDSMVRAIARQAEAERDRRARVISAEGEAQAAQKLVEASQTIGDNAYAMQLRYLNSLQDAAASPASTIVLPLPLEVLERLRPA
ncbi:slipin family protein [Rhodosalinus halophilus]|jgi:regulator of protease activity HflC (stomatin/prohibitin superfamily)|uniref:Slipin family protein n=1 Tax=Rhodosalinus halophilus TaxID=2259333 RepID=A0A365U6B0_9RHOB|nr:slipin family protein [Rhodosalinus halophilus]RBI84045.1 slipin family protein [Rhodosalinus halophilus]